jgi:hypothetical protein
MREQGLEVGGRDGTEVLVWGRSGWSEIWSIELNSFRTDLKISLLTEVDKLNMMSAVVGEGLWGAAF